MQFRPSALSNPNLQQMTLYTPVQRDLRVKGEIKNKLQELREKQENKETEETEEKEAEGLPMPAKIAIGVGVAGALGFLVYQLVK